MSRTIHNDVITELAKDSFVQAHLVQINFDTPVYLTDHAHKLTYNSQDYEAGGHLLGMSPVNESAEMRVGSFNLNLSGVDQTHIAILLGQTTTNRQVLIHRVLLTAAGSIIGDPVLLYDGRISDFTIADQADSSTIVLSVTSHWSDFEKRAGRRTNDASQQAHFPGDKFFEFASQSVRDIKWGRA